MINIGNEVKRELKFDSDFEEKNMFFEKAISILNLQWRIAKRPRAAGIID